MTVRRDSFSFPITNETISDSQTYGPGGGGTVASGCGWTPGASGITTPQLATQANREANLQAVGFQLGLCFYSTLSAGYGGKLGKVVGGLLRPSDAVAGTIVSQVGFTTLPDPTLTVDVWDPAVDALPPDAPSGSNYFTPLPTQVLQCSGLLQLSTPMSFDAMTPFSVGIWMYPSLIAALAGGGHAFSWTVINPEYTLVYDDGELDNM